jgi:SOS-response transcriptional repressor LexA
MASIYPNGLRAAMAQAGIGPTRLGEEIHTSKQNVDRWASGARKLTVPWATKIAKVLNRAPEELLLPGGGSIQRVPLLDRVQAGKLSAPSSQIPVEDVPLLAFADLGRGDFFALQVEGTSMDRISPEGSVIVVDRSDKQLVGGKPYIFSLKGGEATYKLWHPGDPAYLEPLSWDASNKPQFVKRMKELFVIGRVRRTLMDL